MIFSKKRITKALICLRGCAGWSAPLMFTYSRGQVSRVEIMGLVVRKPTFSVSDLVTLKPVCSATVTSWRSEIIHNVAILVIILSRVNKGADQAVQTVCMCRLVCSSIVCMQWSGFLTSTPVFIHIIHNYCHFSLELQLIHMKNILVLEQKYLQPKILINC